MVLLDTLTKFVPWATTAFARAPQPIVNTSNGVYRGLYLPELNQKAFLGIPFAAPPIGDLRFAPPQPYEESWSGVRDATQYGYSCYGMGSFSEFLLSDFNEDCLTLNVVVPIGAQHQVLPSESPTFNGSDLGVQSPLMSSEMEQEAVNELLPVFVWIHGGGDYYVYSNLMILR
jgi:carboxylesterase type B